MKNEITFNVNYSNEGCFKGNHYSITVKTHDSRFYYPDGTITLIIKNGLKAIQNDVEKSIEDVKKELMGYINKGWRTRLLNDFYYKF